MTSEILVRGPHLVPACLSADANAPKFTGVVPADAEELLEQLIVYGTPPEARRRLGRWHEAGAAFPVLLLGPNHTREERALALEAFRPMLPVP